MRLHIFFLATLVLTTTLVAAEDAPDARLDQKVTYQAKGALLHTVCEELTQKTGVAMRSGSSLKDWQVRDRKVTLFVKDMPLRDVHANLAKLLRFRWTKFDSKGLTSYRIIQDAKARTEEESLRVAAAEEKTQKRTKALANALGEIHSIGSLKPEDIDKLKETNPWLHVLATQPIGRSLSQLIKQVPEVRAALQERRKASIEVSSLSPEAQEAVQAYAKASMELMGKLVSGHQGEPGFELVKLTRLEVNKMVVADPDGQEADFFLGDVSTDQGPGIPLFDSTSQVGRFTGKLFQHVIDTDQTPDQAENQRLNTEMEALMQKQWAGWLVKLPEDDPDLVKTIDYKDVKKRLVTLPDYLEILAEKSDLQLFSDHFRPEYGTGNQPTLAESKLKAIIEAIAISFEKQPTKTGKIIRLEDHRWFEKRSWEVSEAQLERWKKLAKQYKLTLSELVEMASLSDAQIEHTLYGDGEMGEYIDVCVFCDERNRQVLRFFGALSSAQQLASQAEQGLSIEALTPAQLVSLQGMAKFDPAKPLVFRLGSDEIDGYRWHTFTLVDLSLYLEPSSEPQEDTVEAPAEDTDTDDETHVVPDGDDSWKEELAQGVAGEWSIRIPTKAPEPCDESYEPEPGEDVPEISPAPDAAPSE